MRRDRPPVRRRKLLAAAGSFAATGCLGERAATGTGGEESVGSAGGDEEADLLHEPVDYPDQRCEVDARNVREYTGWNAQVLHEDGSRAFLCTSGCMGAYYTAPSAFGVSEADIAGLWVTDYGTGETIDGTDATTCSSASAVS